MGELVFAPERLADFLLHFWWRELPQSDRDARAEIRRLIDAEIASQSAGNAT